MRPLDLIIQNKSPEVRNFLLMNRMAGNGVTKVVNKCQEATEDQRLDLSDCMLMTFPDAVYHLMRSTVLLTCDLSCNVLRKIPAKLSVKFTYIIDLNLAHNRLSSLPDELKNMPDLQTINISQNDFSSFPQVLYHLRRVSKIDASVNKITDVDGGRLVTVRSLRDLNLEQNPLSERCRSDLQRNAISKQVAVKVSTPSQEEYLSDLDDLDDV